MRKLKFGVVLQYVFFLGLGIALIWYSSRNLTPEQIGQLKSSWHKANLWYVLPVFFLMLLAHYSRALRWKILMKPLGYTPSATNTFLAVLMGYFFNLLVPRLGEVMKCTVLARYEKVAPDKLVGTILTERVIDMICLLTITLVMVLWQYDKLGGYTFNKILAVLKGKSGGLSLVRLSVAVAGIAIAFLLIKWLFRRYAAVKWVIRIRKLGAGVMAGLQSFTRIENKQAFIGHTLLIWALYLSGIWIGFLSFQPVSHLGGDAALSSLVFGSFGMVVTQGGIGAFQIATQKALSFFDIDAVNGLAFGWLMWGAQTAIVLLSGLMAILVLPLVNHKKKLFTA
jgi:hypothetical protein